jgi:hypothetical protein
MLYPAELFRRSKSDGEDNGVEARDRIRRAAPVPMAASHNARELQTADQSPAGNGGWSSETHDHSR